MKLHYILLFILGITIGYSQNTIKASDINGQWQSTKSGAEIFIDINGSNATISSIGKTTLTKNIVGGSMYEMIHYDGNGVWSAQRNSWIYNGIGGVNSEKGHWGKAEMLKLNLSKDVNTLTTSSHWTYTRVIKKIGYTEETTASTTQKQTITEDFGGVTGTFILVDKPQGGDFVLAKLANKTKDKLAIVIISLDGGKITKEHIEPQITLTKKYDAKTLDIQILYQDAKLPDTSINLIDFVKDKVRIQVTKDKGKLKTAPTGFTGVRG
jgi:hypothetical protein